MVRFKDKESLQYLSFTHDINIYAVFPDVEYQVGLFGIKKKKPYQIMLVEKLKQ